jgi:hypothetical protein
MTLAPPIYHLERERAGADDHRGAELGDRHARLAQRLPGLLARAQVLRERAVRIAESAEIHQAVHAGPFGGVAEGPRRPCVADLEVVAAAHAVNEVIRGVDLRQRGGERRLVEHVTGNRLHLVGPGAPLQPPRIAHHAADVVAGSQQAGDKPPTHVSGRPGNQDSHVGSLPLGRLAAGRRCRHM